jgi:hypothetical protein
VFYRVVLGTNQHCSRSSSAWRCQANDGRRNTDATALKCADIELPWGKKGTDVAKEAADVILSR